jgi:hypothetical protein
MGETQRSPRDSRILGSSQKASGLLRFTYASILHRAKGGRESFGSTQRCLHDLSSFEKLQLRCQPCQTQASRHRLPLWNRALKGIGRLDHVERGVTSKKSSPVSKLLQRSTTLTLPCFKVSTPCQTRLSSRACKGGTTQTAQSGCKDLLSRPPVQPRISPTSPLSGPLTPLSPRSMVAIV